jgi:hypothetical protein
MGTNYYLRTNECEHCGRFDELHIGKSSAGWTFSFQALPGIQSWQDWALKIQEGGRIFNEYEGKIDFTDFEKLVHSKRQELHNHAREYPDGSFLDDEGNSFSTNEFS